MLRKIGFNFILIVSLFFFASGESLAGKSYSSGGGKSYSSVRVAPSVKITPAAPKVTPVLPTTAKSYSNSNKSYTSPGSSTHQPTGPPKNSYGTGTSGYSKKPAGNFQSVAATEQRKAESRAQYQKATSPKETYTTPKGNSASIKKDDVRVTQIRDLPEEKWVNRETRVQTFYSNYYYNTPPTVTHYNDPYSTFFWLWLLDRSLDDRASWAYHHRNEMDDARYKDLLAKDKNLEAKIKQLEAGEKKRDPNYVPAGVEPDLQYTDEFVNATYNPEPKPGITFGDFFNGCWILVKYGFIFAVVLTFVYAVFFYRGDL